MDDSKYRDEASLRDEIVWAAKTMWERGYITGTAGNISTRISNTDRILITPSGANFASVAPEDIVLCTLDGEKLKGKQKPSSEILLHTGIYSARPSDRAIVHGHSTYATALASSRTEIPFFLDELYYSIGANKIPVAEFSKSGTPELAHNVIATLGNKYKAALLANHGTIAVGANIQEALEITEEMEKAANIFILASLTGGVKAIEEYYKSNE